MTLPVASELEQRAVSLLTSWRVRDTSVCVEWNYRLTTTAGRAFLRNGRIELNPKLLAKAPDQLVVVLVHEAAHIAAFRLFGANIPAHGRHWRSLVRLAGHVPEVTHRIPVDEPGQRRAAVRRRRSFFYLRVCEACGERVILEAVRYGRCQGCAARDSFLVMKAPATAAGKVALQRLSLDQVRSAFG